MAAVTPGDSGRLRTVSSVSVVEPLRLSVDFNYGGRDGDRGVVYLHPKQGERSGLYAPIQAQFDAAGVEPQEGLPVILFEPRADATDDGTTCDMEVLGTLEWVEDEGF